MLKDLLAQVRRFDVFAKNTIDSIFAGNYRSAFRGRGIEFADIRPYDFDDDVRDIDWRTTSKQGEVYVKTYHESRDNTLFFVVDGGSSMHFSSIEKKKYTALLEAFTLLAFSAVYNGDRVGVLFYSDNQQKIFPPKKGKKHILKIISYCIEAYEQKNTDKATTFSESNVFRNVQHLLKHSATIFWMMGHLDLPNGLKKELKLLRTKHDVVPMHFCDPLEENWTQAGTFSLQDTKTKRIASVRITDATMREYRKIRTKRKRNWQNFFKKISATPLMIQTDSKIFQTLYIFFQSRKLRTH